MEGGAGGERKKLRHCPRRRAGKPGRAGGQSLRNHRPRHAGSGASTTAPSPPRQGHPAWAGPEAAAPQPLTGPQLGHLLRAAGWAATTSRARDKATALGHLSPGGCRLGQGGPFFYLGQYRTVLVSATGAPSQSPANCPFRSLSHRPRPGRGLKQLCFPAPTAASAPRGQRAPHTTTPSTPRAHKVNGASNNYTSQGPLRLQPESKPSTLGLLFPESTAALAFASKTYSPDGGSGRTLLPEGL